MKISWRLRVMTIFFVFNCSRLAKPVVLTTELRILLRIFSLSLFLLWCLRGAANRSAAEDANHLFESLNPCLIFEICDTSKYLVYISWFLVMTEYLVGHQQCSLTPDKVLLYHMLKCACSAAHIYFYKRLSALRCNNCVCQPIFPHFLHTEFWSLILYSRHVPSREVTLPSSRWRQSAVLSSV